MDAVPLGCKIQDRVAQLKLVATNSTANSTTSAMQCLRGEILPHSLKAVPRKLGWVMQRAKTDPSLRMTA
jgi:hypothetical protein